eukprot:TRINITY_DN15933_c0_g1_i1.p1 TRINITY_DN15933_c0_g1~~TRINITY_DN15933_c0_g1_i1.p1  ORF type:complete len:451 (+),score=59.86 TRINITY_DN15933_c0_g1_i1:86-1354(+)
MDPNCLHRSVEIEASQCSRSSPLQARVLERLAAQRGSNSNTSGGTRGGAFIGFAPWREGVDPPTFPPQTHFSAGNRQSSIPQCENRHHHLTETAAVNVAEASRDADTGFPFTKPPEAGSSSGSASPSCNSSQSASMSETGSRSESDDDAMSDEGTSNGSSASPARSVASSAEDDSEGLASPSSSSSSCSSDGYRLPRRLGRDDVIVNLAQSRSAPYTVEGTPACGSVKAAARPNVGACERAAVAPSAKGENPPADSLQARVLARLNDHGNMVDSGGRVTNVNEPYGGTAVPAVARQEPTSDITRGMICSRRALTRCVRRRRHSLRICLGITIVVQLIGVAVVVSMMLGPDAPGAHMKPEAHFDPHDLPAEFWLAAGLGSPPDPAGPVAQHVSNEPFRKSQAVQRFPQQQESRWEQERLAARR